MSKLTNRKLNNLLKEEINNLDVPDVKEKARKTPIYVNNQPEVAVKPKKSPKNAWVTALVCAVLVVATCLGVFIPTMNNGDNVTNTISYVTIDINPSVTIKLEGDKVVDVTHNNKDGGIVLAGIKTDLKGKSAKEAIDEVLTSSASAGYLVYDNKQKQKENNAVKIGVIGDDGLVLDEVADNIEQDVISFFKQRNLFALVVQDTIIKDKNDESIAKYGITYSKLKLLESVYLMNNKILFVKDKKDFENYVNNNKQARVSDLYKQLLKVDSLAFDKIYKAIYQIIENRADFEAYVLENTNKINEELDAWIRNEINKAKTTISGISNLINEKEQSIRKKLESDYDKIGIDTIIKEIYLVLKDTLGQGTEEFKAVLNETFEWLDSITGRSSDSIFDGIINNDNKGDSTLRLL